MTFRSRRIERGMATIIFGMGVLILMLVVTSLLYSLGRVAVAHTRSVNAMTLSTLAAADKVDLGYFLATQDTIVDEAANAKFLQLLAQYKGREGAELSSPNLHFVNGGAGIQSNAQLSAPFGGAFMPTISIRWSVTVTARPRYGITKEGE